MDTSQRNTKKMSSKENMETYIPRIPGTGSFDVVERGGGHGFRQIILATSCCPMCSAAWQELTQSK